MLPIYLNQVCLVIIVKIKFNFLGFLASSTSQDTSSLFNSVDQLDQLQYFAHLFQKGGSCYEEVVRTHSNTLTDNMHLQFQEIKNVIFRFNKRAERLELCLGVEHVPVGPLTPQQKELCRLAAAGKSTTASSSSAEEIHSIKWLVNKPSASTVKAFSGTGRTLGGSGGSSSSSGATASASKTLTHQQGQVCYWVCVHLLFMKLRLLINEISRHSKYMFIGAIFDIHSTFAQCVTVLIIVRSLLRPSSGFILHVIVCCSFLCAGYVLLQYTIRGCSNDSLYSTANVAGT